MSAFVKDAPPSFPNGKEGLSAEKKLSLKIHPLFLLLGGVYAFTGKLVLFLAATLVAAQHEFAHALSAAKRGYRLNELVLMPYGAVIDGDLKGLSFRDELSVAAAGPLCNLLTAAGFLALWWCFPALYPYTDTAFYLSLSIGLVNLIPAYPLDGGRILNAALCPFAGEKRAMRIARAISFLFSAVLFSVFILFFVRGKRNFSLLLFSLFVFFGNVGRKGRLAFYEKISYSCQDAFSRGAEVKRIAVDVRFPLKKTTRFFEKGKILVLEVYDENERKIAEVSQNQLAEWFKKGEYTAKISDFLSKNGENR